MFGVFKMKALWFGMFLASPAFAAWIFCGSEAPIPKPEVRAVSFNPAVMLSETVVRMPVEVITKGSAPQWVYVEVGAQAVPEPGMFSILGLPILLLVFRRQRG